MADSERRCQLEYRDNGRIATAFLKAAYVLLAEAGYLSEFLLRQTPFESCSPHVAAYQLAHIHCARSPEYIL